MAVLPKASDRRPCSEGEHILTLEGVEIKRIKSAFPDGKQADGMSDVLILHFVSTSLDDDGMPEELDVLLPPAISGKNKTGRMAKMLSPGLDPDTDDFDPDDYVGRRYKAFVAHEDRNGRTYAQIASMKPFTAKGAQTETKPKPAADEEDPFAGE